MTAYISVSFNKRAQLDPELDALIRVLNDFKITPFIFVDHYQFDPAQERLMMRRISRVFR